MSPVYIDAPINQCLDMILYFDSGENIFQLIDREVVSRQLPWSNFLALGSDNANVMSGSKKGVIAHVRTKQPNVIFSGCSLHLIHIGAQKGASCLPPVQDILTDIFYYFQKSDKRRSELAEIQSLFDVDQRKMLKHVCTRWLSIGRLVRTSYICTCMFSFAKTEVKIALFHWRLV